VAVHEGGYSELYVPFCGLAVMEALAGVRTKVRVCMFEQPCVARATARLPLPCVHRTHVQLLATPPPQAHTHDQTHHHR
jgi:hypothetical protein